MKLEYIGLEHIHNTLRCSFLGTRTHPHPNPPSPPRRHACRQVTPAARRLQHTGEQRHFLPSGEIAAIATFPWFVPSATVATMAAVTLSPEGLQADRAQAAWEWWHRIHSGAHSPLTWLAPMVGQVAPCPCSPSVHIHVGLIKASWACSHHTVGGSLGVYMEPGSDKLQCGAFISRRRVCVYVCTCMYECM